MPHALDTDTLDRPWNCPCVDCADQRAAFYSFTFTPGAQQAMTDDNSTITVEELILELQAAGVSAEDAQVMAEQAATEVYDNCAVCDEIDTLTTITIDGVPANVCDVCFEDLNGGDA